MITRQFTRVRRIYFLGALAVTVSAALAQAQTNTAQFNIASGPFQPTWESLEQNYKLPDWYRDAKFGIWAHWGPQCQPQQGDWYAKQIGRAHV